MGMTTVPERAGGLVTGTTTNHTGLLYDRAAARLTAALAIQATPCALRAPAFCAPALGPSPPKRPAF